MERPRITLHILPPAMGLPTPGGPSLAVLAYLVSAAGPPGKLWAVDDGSGPEVSSLGMSELPALHDTWTSSATDREGSSGPGKGTWVFGFDGIVAYLQRPDVLASTHGSLLDPDAFVATASSSTPASEDPDLVAYKAFTRQNLPPLAALSLYASPANWAGVTRPALTGLVTWPLGWTDVPAFRRRRLDEARDVLARLGFGGDDEWAFGGDGELDEEDGEERKGLLRLPGGLGSGMRNMMTGQAGQRPVHGASVTAVLRRDPEVSRRGRLEALAREALDVLEGLRDGRARRGEQQSEPSSGLLYGATADRPTSLDCLAFGHLALMLLPRSQPDLLPRSWLPQLMRREYGGLCEFVEGMLGRVERALATASSADNSSAAAPSTSTVAAAVTEAQQMEEMAVDDDHSATQHCRNNNNGVARLRRAWTVGLRFSDGLMRLLPGGLGSEWKRWRRQQRLGELGHAGGICWQRGDWLLALGGIMTGGLVATAAVLYRSLTPFGAPVQVFARSRRRTASDTGIDLGEIGRMLESWHEDGNDSSASHHGGGGAVIEGEAGLPAGAEIDEASVVLSADTDELVGGTRW